MLRRFTSALVLLVAVPALAQPRHVDSEQWYNLTDDGHRQYVYEMGRAAAPGDTVVVLHGGWGAEHSYFLEALATAPVLAASPNPSRGESRIVVTLPEAQQVSVGVYDVLGREVYRVAPERRAAGAHVFVLDGASLPSGTYTVRVRHGAAVQTQTLHVVR